MTKQDLVKDLRRHTGGSGVITVAELSGYLGYTNYSIVKKKFLIGLTAISGTRYYIPEVAERILKEAR